MLARGRAFLERKGVESARLDAELLVARALGLERLALFLDLDRPVGREEVERARELLVHRARGEPTAYLVGEREFYGRPFRVGPGVLVPRPETELLVDAARARVRGRDPSSLVLADLGTGSGCIAVTLALELPGARVVAVDSSERALAFARENAERLGAEVELLRGDMLADLPRPEGGYDLLVSNPPYVRPGDPAAASEVLAHEPAGALLAPQGDPDHHARRILDAARPLLRPDGAVLLELGHDQGERVLALARERGFEARLLPDLASLPRVLDAHPEPASGVPPSSRRDSKA